MKEKAILLFFVYYNYFVEAIKNLRNNKKFQNFAET